VDKQRIPLGQSFSQQEGWLVLAIPLEERWAGRG